LHTHANTHTHTHTDMHTLVLIHTHAHTDTDTHTLVFAYTNASISLCLHAQLHTQRHPACSGEPLALQTFGPRVLLLKRQLDLHHRRGGLFAKSSSAEA